MTAKVSPRFCALLSRKYTGSPVIPVAMQSAAMYALLVQTSAVNDPPEYSE